MNQRRLLALVAFVGICVALPGCARPVEPTAPSTGLAAHPPLYDRLGGLSGAEQLIDRWVAKVAADSRLKGRFAQADLPRLKKRMVELLCDQGDGPCEYKGRNMKVAHAGMRITNAEFNAMLEDLQAAMQSYSVPRQEQAELLTLLKSWRNDIVEAP